MHTHHDLAEDELRSLLAETAEHLQILESGLVRLEQTGPDSQLLQNIFRAAHTLKGSAGMVNHWRMADLTHALETVLDDLRKGALAVSPPLVDACLEALDALKLLRNELISDELTPMDIETLSKRLLAFSPTAAAIITPRGGPPPAQQSASASMEICVEISPTSLIPAARAFQAALILQSLGKVHDLQPPLSVIESAAPVRRVTARLLTAQPVAYVRRALAAVSELGHLVIDGEELDLFAPASAQMQPEISVSHPLNGGNSSAALQQLADKTVRTSVERLDTLMNLVGELITDRNRLNQLRAELEGRRNGHDHFLTDNLSQTILHLSRLTDQLQQEVMRIRLVPIANLYNKFPRLVRDLARKMNKQVEMVIRGEDTELDRSVIEEIGDPLIHLLRNAVDHGLESPDERQAAGKSVRGVILLTARHEESRIILTVEDDGRGIDLARVRAGAVRRGLITAEEAAALSPAETIELIFRPGLSTAATAGDISGRGVGLDIVRTNIEHINGSVTVETWPGQGTRFQISLPLTLAIIPTLMVEQGGSIFALPLIAVTETLRLTPTEIYSVGGHPVTYLRGHVLPLVRLDAALGLEQAHPTRAYEYVVAIRWGKLKMGLMVDRLIGEQDAVIKSLGALTADAPLVSGAAILGDGRLALILDVPAIFKLGGAKERQLC